MLETLDKVPWGKIHHAYGPATDVPDQLRALASYDDERRKNALVDLHGNIWHQGTIYEATSYTVPFLLELASDQRTPDRTACIILIGDIAIGIPEMAGHRSCNSRRGEMSHAEAQEQERTELLWVARAREAVRRGFPALLTCLEEEDASVSAAAAYVLSRFPEEAECIFPRLTRRFEAAVGSQNLQSALACCIGTIAEQSDEAQGWLEHLLAAAELLPLQIVAAIYLARARDGSNSVAVLDVLVSNLAGGDEIEEIYGWFPWDSGEPSWDIIDALFRSNEGWRRAINSLCTLAVSAQNDSRASHAVYQMMLQTLQDNYSPVADREVLTPRQIELLVGLAHCDSLWSGEPKALNSRPLASIFCSDGIPMLRAELLELTARYAARRLR